MRSLIITSSSCGIYGGRDRSLRRLATTLKSGLCFFRIQNGGLVRAGDPFLSVTHEKPSILTQVIGESGDQD